MKTPDHDPPLAPPTLPSWRIALDTRWEALRRRALRLDATVGRKLTDLGRECQHLAIIAAWFQAGGNITHAAARVGINRRTFRENVAAWRMANPELVPVRPPSWLEPRPRRRKRRRKQQEGQQLAAKEHPP
jgi:Bacterial regulatory protein, Fis family